MRPRKSWHWTIRVPVHACVDFTGMGRWEHFPHGADVGIRGIGSSIAQAFEQAALAMSAVVCELETIQGREVVRVIAGESSAVSVIGAVEVDVKCMLIRMDGC